MKSSLSGRLRKFKLKNTEGLVPIQEAVINSIQAKANHITIEIIRENHTQKQIISSMSKIIAFKITDNGIGLNKENFDSFEEIDSEYKLEIGGKGIGRISYLKVFEEVEIKSIFEETSNKRCRTFSFKNTSKGIENLKVIDVPNDTSLETSIFLKGFRENFRKESPKYIEDIANQLLLHMLEYFIDKEHDFEIKVMDSVIQKEILLNNIYDTKFKNHIKYHTIGLYEEKFDLKYMLLDGKDENEISFVANDRKVLSEKIKKYDGLLKGPFGNNYLVIYLSGNYFDRSTNDERTDFTFPKTSKIEGRLFITLEDIVHKILDFIKIEYKDEYEKLLEDNRKILDIFVKNNPQYRSLYKSNPGILNKINSEMNLDKVDSIFYNLKRDMQKEIKNRINKCNFNDEKSKEKIFKMVSDIDKTNLTEYVINRRLILEFFEKSLQTNQSGKYKTEELLHNIFFPTQTNSDELEYEEHNLWLIDDRLSFHSYAFSDESILKNKDKSGYKRPDILIYNTPTLIKDMTHKYEEENFYIVEFKRPQRDDYTENENPIEQVLNYAKDIREQRLKINGRPVKPNENALIYGFIVCDITPRLAKKAGRYQMIKSPDDGSYYGYFSEEKVFLEIYSFDKILENAKKRNRIFFEKLGIDY